MNCHEYTIQDDVRNDVTEFMYGDDDWRNQESNLLLE